MKNRALLPLLRRHDERLQQFPTRLALEMRVKRSFQRGSRAGLRPRALLFGLAALVGAIAALFVFMPHKASVLKLSDRVNAATSAQQACSVRDVSGAESEYTGQCHLALDGVTVRTEAGSVVSGARNEWTVRRGRSGFKVEPIAPGSEPLRVHVSGGVIEVMGTEFLIEEREQSGSVTLYSGKIRFSAADRPSVVLAPGEHLTWTRTPEPPAAVSSETPSVSVAVRPHVSPPSGTKPGAEPAVPEMPAEPSDVEQEIARALLLRSVGQYREALLALDALRLKPLDMHTREVLSFEQGTILERIKAQSSCTHWGQHLSQFPAGRYRSLVEGKLARCGSEPVPKVNGEAEPGK